MKKRVFLLILCLLTLTVSLCLFTGCDEGETPDNGGGTTDGGSTDGGTTEGGSIDGGNGGTKPEIPGFPLKRHTFAGEGARQEKPFPIRLFRLLP